MSAFHINCTVAPDVRNYVASPNARGTLDILWSCLSVLILCTWTIQHLNVPPQVHPRGTKQELKLKLYLFLGKLKWMVLAFLAPECLLGVALAGLFSVLYSCKTMMSFAEEDKVDWSMKHAYFANMGGFALRFSDNTPKAWSEKDVVQQRPSAYGDAGQPRDRVDRADLCLLPLRAGNQRIQHIPAIEKVPKSPAPCKDEIAGQSEVSDFSKIRLTLVSAQNLRSESPLSKGQSPTQNSAACIPRPLDTSNLEDSVLANTASTHASGIAIHRDVSKCPPDPTEDGKPTDDYGMTLKSAPNRHGIEDWQIDESNLYLAKTALRLLAENEPSLRLRARQRNVMALQGNIWILDAAQIEVCRKLNILAHIPNISEQSLDDQNKGDILLKALALLQVVWLVVTLIVRTARGLPSSQLELIVAAFSGCSCIIYGLFWSKPKDVATTRYFAASKYPSATELLRVAVAGPTTFFHYRKGYWIPNNAVHRVGALGVLGIWSPINSATESIWDDQLHDFPRLVFIIGTVVGAVVFGAPHLAAWSFEFPTAIERLLWRIAALGSVTIPVIGTMAQLLFSFLYKRWRHSRHRHAGAYQVKYLNAISIIIWIFAIPYLVARLYILVEAVRCLCFLPPEAFRTTWAADVPHFG